MTTLTAEEETELLNKAADSVITRLLAADVLKVPKERKKRTNWERLLAYEYCDTFFRDCPKWVRIEVGPIPKEGHGMMYARTRRWADAVIIDGGRALILETKMKADPRAIGQLQIYRNLFPETPGFSRFKELPITLRLVAALGDEHTRLLAEEQEIEYEEWRPSNFEKWYAEVVAKQRKK